MGYLDQSPGTFVTAA